MALIGSTRKIVNHVLRGDVRTGDVDDSFSAVAETVGGTAWADGVPTILPANLDLTNLGEMSFSNSFKREARSYWTASVYGELQPYLGTDSNGSPGVAFNTAKPVPFPVVSEGVLDGVSIHSMNAGAVGVIKVYLNATVVGSQEVSISLDKPDSASPPVPGFDNYNPLPPADWIPLINDRIAALGYQSSVMIPLGVAVHPGDIVCIDTSELSWDLYPGVDGLQSAGALYVPIRADLVFRSLHEKRGIVGMTMTDVPTIGFAQFGADQRTITVRGTTVTGQGPVLIRILVDGNVESWTLTDGATANWEATISMLTSDELHRITASAQAGGRLRSLPTPTPVYVYRGQAA